jgi:hypothetical protein
VYRGYDKNVANDFAQKMANMIQNIMGTKQPGKVGTRIGTDGEYYGVLRGARAAGLTYYYIIEHSFHTNYNATKWLMSDDNLKLLAKEEAEFIVDYFVNKKTSAPTVNTTTSSTTSSSSLTAGTKLTLSNNNVYASSAANAQPVKKSGTFYIWSDQVVNGRIRITNALNRVGVSGQVSGWMNVSDITTTGTTSSSSTSTSSTSSKLSGNYSLIFDANYYANRYPDLMSAFGKNAVKLLDHFNRYGITEGRQAHPDFNVQVYKANNEDLHKAFGNSGYDKYFQHYLTYGHKENRKCV